MHRAQLASAIQAAKKPTESLDLPSLVAKLKATDSVSLASKFALKRQIDDLLRQVRAVHHGESRAPMGDLRKSYDGVVVRVVSLVQDREPSLASAVIASRERIWSILADPEEFNKLPTA